ncbi:MAG TPA: hypothetical protein PKK06_07780 [Phycisphaerae bacterium]|nr:hypothetical protein [Phycisphaerae bacterium]HNU46064.1 hypothetical protein [Phycisphaerae bacterium]
MADQVAPAPELIRRLHALRRQVRLRLVLYGLGAVAAGTGAAALGLMTLDWLVQLPGVLRLAVGVAFVGGVGLAAWYWIIHPWCAPLGLTEVASRVDRYFAASTSAAWPTDELTSAVSFLEHPLPASAALVERTIARAEQRLRGHAPVTALTKRPLTLRFVQAGLVAVVFGLLGWQVPEWVGTGWRRYAAALSGVEWPRAVELRPLTGDLRVPVGESATVRVEVTRGLQAALRPVVHLAETTGAGHALAMVQEEPGRFAATLDAVTSDLTYWFEAGDADTRARPFTIRVVRRPEVVEALATVEPPPYARQSPPRVHDLRAGPVRAPVGGAVELALRVSKPPADDDGTPAAALRLDPEGRVPLRVAADDPLKLTGRLPIREDLAFGVELRDAEGFESRAGARYLIVAEADRAPTVALLEPRSTVELTPRGALPVRVRVEDDFGIQAVELAGEALGRDTVFNLPLNDRLSVEPADDGVRAVVSHVWNVESLGLQPGDAVVFHADAWDNRQMPEAGPQRGSSAPLRLKIISEVEFEQRVRDDLAQVDAQVRRALTEQIELRDHTGELLNALVPPQPLNDPQREAALADAGRQGRLSQQVQVLAGKLDALHQRLELNRSGLAADRAQLRAAARALHDVAGGPMQGARTRLGTLRERTDAPGQQQALADAARTQEEAGAALRALVEQMGAWGDFQAVVTRTRDLRSRQQELRTRTAELGNRTLGQTASALDPADATQLARLRRQQEQLVADLAQLLQRMEQLATVGPGSDEAAAAALAAAQRAARANDAERHLSSAADALGDNRIAAAALAQRQAEEAFSRMLEALEERQSRQLAQLRKRVDDARQQVARLFEQQQALRAATAEADKLGAREQDCHDLAQTQRTLARDTRLTARELAEAEGVLTAARLVDRAAEPMNKAEQRLEAREPAAAAMSQDEALKLLEAALAELEELARRLEELELKQSLDRLRARLEEVLTAQEAINAALTTLVEAVGAAGQLRRPQAREAARLAREQQAARVLVDELRPDLSRAVVYDWALTRVREWMGTSRDRLEERRLDGALLLLVERIPRELRTLIAALDQTAALPPPTEFMEEGGSSGGGAAAAAARNPVPALTELLVLKALQQQVNERTAAVAAQFEPAQATEAQLAVLKTLGEDQAQVQELTRRVTQRARQP